MLQPNMIELGYGDEPVVIDLNKIVAPEVGRSPLQEVAGLAIRVTEPYDNQGWDADVRGSFHYVDADQNLHRPVRSPIGSVLMDWQRPQGSRFSDAVILEEGDRWRLGVQTHELRRRGQLNNDLRVVSHDHRRAKPNLTDFLKVGYQNEHLGIKVMHRRLVARVAFFDLDTIQEHTYDSAPEAKSELEELCEAAILPSDFGRDLSNEQVLIFLNRHRRTINAVLHPDTDSKASEGRAKDANAALDQLIDRFTASSLPGDGII